MACTCVLERCVEIELLQIQDFMHTQDQARDPAREEVYRRAQAMNVIDSMEPRGIPELQKCIATVSQIIADSSNKQRYVLNLRVF